MKQRICVSWFEHGKPMERGFRVDNDMSRIRKTELAAISKADKTDGVTVYATSDDGDETYGFYVWDGTGYKYSELG